MPVARLSPKRNRGQMLPGGMISIEYCCEAIANLIEKQDFRVSHQSPCNCNSL
jgi:hypothetical protein